MYKYYSHLEPPVPKVPADALLPCMPTVVLALQISGRLSLVAEHPRHTFWTACAICNKKGEISHKKS
jgi:hypothetical protein